MLRIPKDITTLHWLVCINLAVFVLVRLADFLALAGVADHGFAAEWLSVPLNVSEAQKAPWALITYMFTHYEFLHLLLNVLCLYWFGKLFEFAVNPSLLLTTYIGGGLAGLFFTWLCVAFLPYRGLMLGASASVMAIILCVTLIAPDREVLVPLVGSVKLKYYALFFVLVDIISIPGLSNIGGHFAHLGGALFGAGYGLWMRARGVPPKPFYAGLIAGLSDRFAELGRRKSPTRMTVRRGARPETDEQYNRRRADREAEIDRLLDKIRASGYDSLSKVEKETLFRESQNL